MVRSRIGISLRIVTAQNYDEKRDALSHDWPTFLEKLNLNPIFIPNSLSDVKSYLDDMHIDGLILSGGDNLGDFPERDKTEKDLLDYAVQNKIPVLGVCRGMQVINDYFGGSIEKSTDVQHVGKNHLVELTNEICLPNSDSDSVLVNSFHYNLIQKNTLGRDLKPFAIAKFDGTIEGFSHKDLPIFGVMWHPERDQNKTSESLFRKVFHNIIKI